MPEAAWDELEVRNRGFHCLILLMRPPRRIVRLLLLMNGYSLSELYPIKVVYVVFTEESINAPCLILGNVPRLISVMYTV